MIFPALRYGQKNKAVLALQNGLHRALAKKGLKHENLRNRGFGARTSRDLLRFRRAYMTPKGPIKGRAVGSDVWKAIRPFLGESDLSLIRQHNRAVAAARAAVKAAKLEKANANTSVARRARVKAVALKHYALRAHYVYRQVRPMPPTLFSPFSYYKLDCSSTFTLHYKEAGEPDPNGRNYDGHGYTGTMVVRGVWVRFAQPADAVFYGDQGGGVPSHMATAVGDGLAVSFGSTPVRLVTYDYRRDKRGYKSYID